MWFDSFHVTNLLAVHSTCAYYGIFDFLMAAAVVDDGRYVRRPGHRDALYEICPFFFVDIMLNGRYGNYLSTII